MVELYPGDAHLTLKAARYAVKYNLPQGIQWGMIEDDERTPDGWRSVYRRARSHYGADTPEEVLKKHVEAMGAEAVDDEEDLDDDDLARVTVSETAEGLLLQAAQHDAAPDLDEAMATAEIDPLEWALTRKSIDRQDKVSKGGQKHRLWRIQAWFERISLKRDYEEIKQSLMSDLRSVAPKGPRVATTKLKREQLLELVPADLHLGRHSWGEEAGVNYNTDEAVELFRWSVRNLVEKARHYNVSRILLALGNDFFNVDNSQGTTTAGTRQQEDTRWQRSYRKGRQAVIGEIKDLAKEAPVDVIVVPGNHDMERAFYLGDAIEVAFDGWDQVSVNNAPAARKYYRYGDVGLGFTHGNKETHKDLPSIMFSEARAALGQARFLEFHIGHLHGNQVKEYTAAKDVSGVIVRVFPALAAKNDWEASMGYQSNRGAHALIWHPQEGLQALLPVNVIEDREVSVVERN